MNGALDAQNILLGPSSQPWQIAVVSPESQFSRTGSSLVNGLKTRNGLVLGNFVSFCRKSVEFSFVFNLPKRLRDR